MHAWKYWKDHYTEGIVMWCLIICFQLVAIMQILLLLITEVDSYKYRWTNRKIYTDMRKILKQVQMIWYFKKWNCWLWQYIKKAEDWSGVLHWVGQKFQLGKRNELSAQPDRTVMLWLMVTAYELQEFFTSEILS